MNTSQYGIVILSYNHPEITARCIDSVLQHGHNTNALFLVHNGSETKHQQQLEKSYPQIQHIYIKQNRGYSGGANDGLEAAFKKFSSLLLLTNDTEIVQLPDRAPVGFNSIVIYKRNTDQIDSISGLIDLKLGKLSHLKSSSLPNSAQQIYIPGTAFWIDQTTFTQIGGFDETFHTYWEDVDFSYRAHQLKIPLNINHDTVVKHKIGKTCHKNEFYTYYLYQRNRKKFMTKHQLQSWSFWLSFTTDVIRLCKYRYRLLWRILND